jgi:hypothetical protein
MHSKGLRVKSIIGYQYKGILSNLINEILGFKTLMKLSKIILNGKIIENTVFIMSMSTHRKQWTQKNKIHYNAERFFFLNSNIFSLKYFMFI